VPNIRKLTDAGVCLLAICSLAAACGRGRGPAGNVHPMSIFGTAVKPCSEVNHQYSRVIWVELTNAVEDLGGNNVVRSVRYANTNDANDNNTDEYENAANDLGNGASVNGEVRPYDIDFNGMTTITNNTDSTNSFWNEVRILLHDDPSNSASASKFKYYTNSTYHGIAIQPGTATSPDDVCVGHADGVPDNQHNDVLHVFIKTPPTDAAGAEYDYNILLVGKNGATSTPISIDPKILNNG
jgi:hypothetical protein